MKIIYDKKVTLIKNTIQIHVSILPHRRDWKFLGWGGVSKAKTFKELFEA